MGTLTALSSGMSIAGLLYLLYSPVLRIMAIASDRATFATESADSSHPRDRVEGHRAQLLAPLPDGCINLTCVEHCVRRYWEIEEAQMDFVERLFHISPDHGTGFTEITICLIFIAIPLLFRAVRNRSKRSV